MPGKWKSRWLRRAPRGRAQARGTHRPLGPAPEKGRAALRAAADYPWRVALLAHRVPEDAPGDLFVDTSCIACVSTTRRDFPWSNTHHVTGDLARAVKALKKATPRGLMVGSPKPSAALQRLDLVDEYRFVVHPVVAGHGPYLFSDLQPSLRLKFVASTRLKSGIVALHYRRR